MHVRPSAIGHPFDLGRKPNAASARPRSVCIRWRTVEIVRWWRHRGHLSLVMPTKKPPNTGIGGEVGDVGQHERLAEGQLHRYATTNAPPTAAGTCGIEAERAGLQS